MYWYLWLGTLVTRLGSFVVPFLAIYLVGQRGLSVGRAALVVSLFGIGSFVAGPAGGVLADRLGRRRTMLIALWFAAASMLALGFARGFSAIAAVTPVLGFFTDLYRPAASAVVADVVRPADRARAYGMMYWAVNVGAAIAPLLAGLAATRSYLALFVADALTTLVFALLVWVRVAETRPDEATRPGELIPVGGVGLALRDPTLLALTGLSFGFASIFFQGYVTLPIIMRAEGLTAAQYGAVIAVNGLVIVAFGIPASRIVSRLPRFRVLAAAAALMGAGFGLSAWAHTVPLYALAVAVWTLGELTAAPVAPAVVADLSPVHLRGVYQGVYGTAWGLASFAGPALGGAALERFGARALWSGCLLLGIAVAVGFLMVAGAVRRRGEIATSPEN